MAARKENIFKSGEMREVGKGGKHEETQCSEMELFWSCCCLQRTHSA